MDGTGDDISKIAQRKADAEQLGYDTMMVFVNTSLNTAIARNRARDRQLPDSFVRQSWTAAQANRKGFAEMFETFVTVSNDNDTPIVNLVRQFVARFIRLPIQNPLGREWLAAAHALAV
jgi:predicted kinase